MGAFCPSDCSLLTRESYRVLLCVPHSELSPDPVSLSAKAQVSPPGLPSPTPLWPHLRSHVPHFSAAGLLGALQTSPRKALGPGLWGLVPPCLQAFPETPRPSTHLQGMTLPASFPARSLSLAFITNTLSVTWIYYCCCWNVSSVRSLVCFTDFGVPQAETNSGTE